MKKILILGDGAWGTALGIYLYKLKNKVTIWGNFPEYIKFLKEKRENIKFLPGVLIPREIDFTADLNKYLDSNYIIVAVPIRFMREVLKKIDKTKVKNKLFIVVSKGIENNTLLRGTEIVKSILEDVKIGGLFGPSHAEEVAREIPTAVVATAEKEKDAKEIQDLFFSKNFRVYINLDLIGVELGAALKNVIAIAVGICDGLGFGENTKAALITRGIVEIARFGKIMGANPETFYGLSGLGDLIATAFSKFSRNRYVGERIGKGEKLSDILSSMEQVAEGVWTVKSVVDLSKKMKIEMPISFKVYQILFENLDPLKAVEDLMMREKKREYILMGER